MDKDEALIRVIDRCTEVLLKNYLTPDGEPDKLLDTSLVTYGKSQLAKEILGMLSQVKVK